MKVLSDKKGLSPVIASIILCSAVIIIGVSVWSFTYSASSILQTDYYEEIQADIDKIGERFTVEHVAYIDGSLHVWVYNYGNITKYGDIDILVDVSVWKNETCLAYTSEPATVPRGELVEITLPLSPAPTSGSELIVQVRSRRENVEYQTYVIPIT